MHVFEKNWKMSLMCKKIKTFDRLCPDFCQYVRADFMLLYEQQNLWNKNNNYVFCNCNGVDFYINDKCDKTVKIYKKSVKMSTFPPIYGHRKLSMFF